VQALWYACENNWSQEDQGIRARMVTHATIVIPTCNRHRELERCLSALQSQIPLDDSVEVFVCDDGNTEEAKELLRNRYRWVQWLQGPRRGAAANRNIGAREASGQWLIFLDDDCTPRADWLAAYISSFQTGVSNRLILEGPTFAENHTRSLLLEGPHNPTGGRLLSCNFAILRALFDKVNGFDERYSLYFEDTELHARLRQSGYSVRFLPEAAVDHPLRRIPSARKLAMRWEVRVVSTLDWGASPQQVYRKLPEHIFKVILSRFYKARICRDNIVAALVFSLEFLWTLYFLPGWMRTRLSEPRSAFWAAQLVQGKAPRHFGL
jgi:GT2 family glycosyltransferase